MSGEFLTVAATPSAEQSAVGRAPLGVSDEAMTGAWRVIIGRVSDRYVAYYYHENDDVRLKSALKLQAELGCCPWMKNTGCINHPSPTPSFDELPEGCFRGTEAPLGDAWDYARIFGGEVVKED